MHGRDHHENTPEGSQGAAASIDPGKDPFSSCTEPQVLQKLLGQERLSPHPEVPSLGHFENRRC